MALNELLALQLYKKIEHARLWCVGGLCGELSSSIDWCMYTWSNAWSSM